ncbi:hypothetical protein D9619_009277 [Psilocybe cf. subviscida]|uniref:Uncharacterized protein n=1 Tax=Psilocybe cf. subviscida TaxID=2480587 RepID=A0A8H5BU25_9AGAR|nr:hypothetical protein D9619_009277 [Psilocybe cf. subviscida]
MPPLFGTLWTTSVQGKGRIIKAVAALIGVKITLPEDYDHFVDNRKPKFLSKFPNGMVPAWEGDDGYVPVRYGKCHRFLESAEDPHQGPDSTGGPNGPQEKSGPGWPKSDGQWTWWTDREARPVHGHPIQDDWLSIGKHICERLDSLHVEWTFINPLAYANEDEAKPFCPLVVCICVEPESLSYQAAVSAATAVKEILALAGFGTIEVAFVESAVSLDEDVKAYRPKLRTSTGSINLDDDEYGHHKHFSTTLGLSIAIFENPQTEGTGALYFRLGRDNDRTVLLAPAHVRSDTMCLDDSWQLREGERIISPGNTAYNHAVEAVTHRIGRLQSAVKYYSDRIGELGEPVEGGDPQLLENRERLSDIVKESTRGIRGMEKLLDKVTMKHATLEERTIGVVLHSTTSSEPYGFPNDWALIELDNDKIDWPSFYGNKMYIGSIPPAARTWGDELEYPMDGLLQATGIVSDDEMRNPQGVDAQGERCLLVAKNGSTTGVTFGRVNGLESFRRDPATKHVSIALAVLPYIHWHGDDRRGRASRRFSAPGDDGAVVLASDGRIVGILTGGMGLEKFGYMGMSYLAPYWWLDKQIKAKFPESSFYEVVESNIWWQFLRQ